MSQENADVMIEVIDLHKYFKEVHVLKGVSTQITRGEVVAVMGPSGGGKSTFLRCMNRLEEPSSGQIIVEGIDITSPYVDINKVRTEIGMVFQLFNLFPHLTAIENVKLAPMHVRRCRTGTPPSAAWRCWTKSGCATRPTTTPTSSPAASNSAWRSRVPWQCSRRSCSLTSRPPLWIRK